MSLHLLLVSPSSSSLFPSFPNIRELWRSAPADVHVDAYIPSLRLGPILLPTIALLCLLLSLSFRLLLSHQPEQQALARHHARTQAPPDASQIERLAARKCRRIHRISTWLPSCPSRCLDLAPASPSAPAAEARIRDAVYIASGRINRSRRQSCCRRSSLRQRGGRRSVRCNGCR